MSGVCRAAIVPQVNEPHCWLLLYCWILFKPEKSNHPNSKCLKWFKLSKTSTVNCRNTPFGWEIPGIVQKVYQFLHPHMAPVLAAEPIWVNNWLVLYVTASFQDRKWLLESHLYVWEHCREYVWLYNTDFYCIRNSRSALNPNPLNRCFLKT